MFGDKYSKIGIAAAIVGLTLFMACAVSITDEQENNDVTTAPATATPRPDPSLMQRHADQARSIIRRADELIAESWRDFGSGRPCPGSEDFRCWFSIEGFVMTDVLDPLSEHGVNVDYPLYDELNVIARDFDMNGRMDTYTVDVDNDGEYDVVAFRGPNGAFEFMPAN